MLRAVLAIGLVLGVAARGGTAAADARTDARVVLADPDPELRRAVEAALAPWHLVVVAERGSPADDAAAQVRADAAAARFVVWRDGAEIVVYDRDRAAAERRDAAVGPLDPVRAAAAALTIKTMMRLPPPPDAPRADDPVRVDAAPLRVEAGASIRVLVGGAGRIAGGDALVGARAGGAVLVRPWAAHGWRFGVAGEAGTGAAVSRAGFKGTWSDWAVLAAASWTLERGAWQLEPYAGAGVARSSLVGTEAAAARSESATLAALRAGVRVGWRSGRWSVGAAVELSAWPGTPTYTKQNDGAAEIFAVPTAAGALGVWAAADFAP